MDRVDTPAPAPTASLPARWYCDVEVFTRECEDIFGREWLLVGHAAILSEAGDRHEQHLAGRALSVGRDPVRGLSGSWRRIDESVSRSASLTLQAWRGFVFANVAPDAAPLSEALAELERRAGGHAIEGYRFQGEARHVLACNWKTYVDNYLEGYHLPMVHPGFARQIDTKSYRVHVGHRAALHEAATRDGTAYEGLWIWLYPNLAINLYGGGMSVERVLPLAHDRTCIHYWFFFADGTPDAEIAEARRICAEVTGEDQKICEAVQRNLAAGVYHEGPLSPRHESALWYFQSLVKAALRDRSAAGDAPGRGARK